MYKDIIDNNLFKHGPITIFIWKNAENWPVEEVTDNLTSIYGYRIEDFKSGKIKYADLIHPDDISGVFEEVTVGSQSPNDFFTHKPYRLKDSSGKYRWVKDITSIIRDTQKNITHYLGYLIDITAEKEKELEYQKKIITARDNLNNAQELAKIGSWTLDIKSGNLEWSDEIYNIFELNKKSFVASYEGFLNAIHPDDRAKVNDAFTKSLENKTPYEINHRLKMDDGRIKYVHEKGESYYNDAGEPILSHGTVQDTTKTTIVENKLKTYLQLIDENIITSTTNLKGIIIEVSEAFSIISGYSKEELIGKSQNIVRHPDMSSEVYRELWKSLKEDKTWEGDIKNIRKNGTHYWVHAKIYPIYNENGEKIGYTAIRQDISDKKMVEALVITDGLTNIFNRRHFNDSFPKMILEAKKEEKFFTFLILDVDYFKQYNDNYGHQKGDEALISIARTLQSSLQSSHDFAFRLGGEEFGMLFLSLTDKDADAFAESLRKTIENLHIFHEKSDISQYITVSIGLVVKKFDELSDMDTIYKEADELLYYAKHSGRNRVCSNLKK